MKEVNKNTIPREAQTGRPVYFENQRKSANRAAMFAIAGGLVLCVCLCIGLAGIGYGTGFFGSDGQSAGLSLPSFAAAKPSPTPAATLIPYQKSAKDESGLRVTVSGYQRPLPAQDITIPEGQELVLVTVRIDNTRTTGGPIKYGPESFNLESPNGDSFAPDNGSITTGEMLKEGELASGKSVRGDMVFYIYSDIKQIVLNWTSSDGTVRQFALGRK
ncbi:MAG: DUF4352 domain-containing protein [Rudaea sp.]